VLIVTYHAIASPSSPVCCPPAQLEADLETLAHAGFTFVSLDECADWLSGAKPLPPRSIAVTFDDAYANVVSDGLPILLRFRVPATIFAIVGRLGGDNQWPGQWRSIRHMPLASAQHLQELAAAGMTIGSHSLSHPALTAIDAGGLHRELEESADQLEQILRTAVRHFAYPYGIRGAREVAAVRRRFRTAVNATPGLVSAGANPYDLCRIDCHDLRLAARLKWFDSSTLGPYLAARRGLRRVRRATERLLGAS
jgi:peptidoglycan/xylan/chitin deacetylase (PgdA/CDA1 family)